MADEMDQIFSSLRGPRRGPAKRITSARPSTLCARCWQRTGESVFSTTTKQYSVQSNQLHMSLHHAPKSNSKNGRQTTNPRAQLASFQNQSKLPNRGGNLEFDRCLTVPKIPGNAIVLAGSDSCQNRENSTYSSPAASRKMGLQAS